MILQKSLWPRRTTEGAGKGLHRMA
jgi:hypothetical protein